MPLLYQVCHGSDLHVSGLCPDWEDWDPKKAKQNAKEAMDAAEKWLDVPQVTRYSHALVVSQQGQV